MRKENDIVLPIIFIVLLIIGISIIIGDKVLVKRKEEISTEKIEKVKGEEKKEEIEEPKMPDDKKIIKENVIKYIKDTDYESVSLYDKEVKELYKKTCGTMSFCYYQEGLTNDIIITLVLMEMDKLFDDDNMTIEKVCKYENSCDEVYKYKDLLELTLFDMGGASWKFTKNDEFDKLFDETAKKLFGDNVKYDIESYNGGFDNCSLSYEYNKDEKKLIGWQGTGCGFCEDIIRKLDYAYKTDDKFVLIEKSLYLFSGGSGDCYEHDGLKYKEEGIYNNYFDGRKLASSIDDCSVDYIGSEPCYTKYKDDLTYYAYTFNKRDDGSYYLADFSRLK